MTPKQIEIVRTTFAALVPHVDEVARAFYARLFELEPSLCKLFRGDLREQGDKLMRTLAIAVSSLDRLDALRPQLIELGRRHVGYGVRSTHYGVVGNALEDTLRVGLAGSFTDEVRDAWLAAYALLAGVMQQGAGQAPTRQAA